MFVGSAKISADGKYLVTGSWDETVRLWEVETGNEIRQFFGNPGFVYSVAISADAKYVAAGSPEGIAVLWDAVTGKELLQLEGHTATVSSITLSADNKYVLTGSWDKTARLWDATTGKEVQRFAGHASKVDSIAITADAKYVATGAEDGTAYLWDAATGKEVQRFMRHSGSVRSIAIAADGKYLATGSEDETARVWDVATGKEVSKYKGHSDAVIAVGFLPDGKVVSGSFDRTARVWDAATGREVRKFQFNSNRVFSVSTSPDAKYVVVSSQFSTVQLFETETGKEAQRFEGRSASVGAVALSADGRYMLIGSWDTTARLWETGTGKEATRFVGHSRPIKSAVISNDSKYIVTGGLDNTARLWEVATGRELRRFAGHSESVEAVAISRSGEYVLTGSGDNTARLWDAATGKEVRRFVGHSRGLTAVAFSPDGKFVLTGSNDDTARLWDAATGKEVRQFVGQSGPRQVVLIDSQKGTQRYTGTSEPTTPEAVAFIADGKYVLVGGDDGVTRLWEAATGKEVRKFDGHAGWVTSLALSPDEKYLVTGSNDNTVRLWEVETSKLLQRFEGHSGWVNSVALSPDSKYILSGGRDSTSRLWEAATGRELCSLVFFDDDNWVVVTPAGLFDGSDLEEIGGAHWLMDGDPMRTYPLEIFMRDYYEPGLLVRLLNGETFRGTRNISELNRAQPTVKIVSGERQGESDMVTITVEVAGARSERQRGKDGRPLETGVYDLRLFRDGQLVGQMSDGAPQALSPSASRRERLLAWRKESEVRLDRDGRRVVKFENIRLPRRLESRRVVFSAYAFNEDRVKSQTARQGFVLPLNLKPLKGRAYVVMFGVNAYEAECLSLDYAVNDVRQMQETFVNKLKESGQYEEVIEVPLIADYMTGGGGRVVAERSATKENLKTVFDLLSGKQVDAKLLAGIPNAARLKPATPDDMVTVFFSGHGDSDERGNFYIVPYNIGQTKLCRSVPVRDEDYNQVLARSISSEELSLWLRYVDAGEMIMIVDACHSAAAVQGGEFKPGPMGSRGLGQLAYDKRMRILAATQSDSVAREFRELNQSVLSYVLTKEGIEEGRADFRPADQVVTTTEWLQYGEARVPEWYENKRKEMAKRKQAGAITPALQSDKHLAHGGSIKQIQVPSLFDFTRRKQDSVLFRKAAALSR